MNKKHDIYYFKKVLKKYKEYNEFKKGLIENIHRYFNRRSFSTWSSLIGYAYVLDDENFIHKIQTTLLDTFKLQYSLTEIINNVLMFSNVKDHNNYISTKIYNLIKEKYDTNS